MDFKFKSTNKEKKGYEKAFIKNLSASLVRRGTTFGMIAILIILGIHSPQFFAPNNILDVFKQGSILTLIALSQTLILAAGGFDMSAGALSQLTCNISAGLIIAGWGTGEALGLGSLVGLLIGLFNALLVIIVRIPAFVATLGTMFILMGASLFYNKGQALTLHNKPDFFFLGQGYLGPLPFIFFLVLIIVVVLHIFLKKTKPGLRIYAVGENLAAAKLRGVSQNIALLIVFSLGGAIVGFTGVTQASYNYGASALATGMDFMISALAAAFLGSTFSKTGELSVIGTAIAGMFIGALSNGLLINGVSNLAMPGILGSILVISVLLTVIHKREIGQVTIF